MKIVYIFPPLGFAGRKVASMSLVPPVLEYMAGLTLKHRPDWQIRLIYANREDVDVGSLECGAAFISILTHQAKWAYALAGLLRGRGIKVVLGGPHPSVMTDEAALHADAVVVGEAESVMEELLSDLESERLKPVYRGVPLPLDGLAVPKRDLLKGYMFKSFSTSRGCPYACKFCVTPELHGRKMRYRPIPEVISDIASFKSKYWFSTDPDIWGPDVDRYIDLFREMSVALPSISWYGEANLAPVQHKRGDELLKWARRAGLMQVGIGLECVDSGGRASYGALPKVGADAEAAIKKIRDNGIDVVVFIMLGGLNDTLASYDNVLEYCDRLSVAAHPVMLVPYPGTAIRQEWAGKLLYENNWDMYDGMHIMSRQGSGEADEHNRKLLELWSKLFTVPRIAKRLLKISPRGFPSAHIASGIFQFAIRSAFGQYMEVYGKSKAEEDRVLGRSDR